MCSLLFLTCLVTYVSGFGTYSGLTYQWKVTQPDPCPTHCGQSNQTLFGSVRCTNQNGGSSTDSRCDHLERPPRPNITCSSTHQCTWAMGENCKDVCESLDATTECDMQSMRMFGRYDFYKAEDLFDFECTEYVPANSFIRNNPHINPLGHCTYAGNVRASAAIECDYSEPGDQRICACKMPIPTVSPSVSPTAIPSRLPTPMPTGPSPMPSWSPTKSDPACDYSSGNRKVLTPISRDDCPEDLDNLPICNGNERPGIDSFRVGEFCRAFGYHDWLTPGQYYLQNCDLQDVFQVQCAPQETPDVCPSAPLISNAPGVGSCGVCFTDAYCRYYCKCSGIGLSFVDDCTLAEFDGQELRCVLRIGETAAPSLTPTESPTVTTTTRHPTPDIIGEICDWQMLQGRLSELTSCMNSGSPCCEQYDSLFSCPLASDRLPADLLSELRLSCRQTCSSLPECLSTPPSTTSFIIPTTLLTLPPIIPTLDDNDCGFDMLISYQSELTDLATCLSEAHTISVHEGSSCCPRYRSILTSACSSRIDASHLDEIRSTCSTICWKDQHCPNNQIITESVRLDGDFELIVAPDKTTFLTECSAQLSPIDCIDARPGSIIIDLQGPSDEVRLHIEKIETEGIQLPSYPALEMLLPEEEVKEQKGASNGVGVGIMVGLLSLAVCCCCLGIYYYVSVEGFVKSSQAWFDEESKAIEIQQPHSMEGVVEREITSHSVDLEKDWNQI